MRRLAGLTTQSLAPEHPSRRPQVRAPQDEASDLMVRGASSRVSNHEVTGNALMPLVLRRRRRVFRNREVLVPGGLDLMRRRGLVVVFRRCAGRPARLGAVGYQQ